MSDEKKKEPTQRLVGVHFVSSVPMGGESMSMYLRKDGSGTADAIVPARLERDGQCVGVESNQRADGLRITKKIHDRINNRYFVAQCFVPFQNCKALLYSEE
jgi:hypothetical protein